MKWSLIIANMKRLGKDFKLLLGVFSAPIIVILVISTLTSSTGSIQTINMGIVNQDGGALSEKLIEQLQNDETLSIKLYDEEEARSEYLKKRLPIILTIPEGFFENALTGEAVEMKFMHVDTVPGDTIMKQTEQIVKALLQERLFIQAGVDSVELINRANTIQFEKAEFDKEPDGFMTTSFIITFMMLSIIFLSQELIDLRNKNLLFRMFATPNRPSQLTGSLMSTMFFFFALQAILLFWIGSVSLQAPLLSGNIPGSILILACFILVNLSLGVLVGRLCKNTSMIGIWANIMILPTGIISGIFVPKEFLPEFLNKISFLAPQYWVMDGLQKMNGGLPIQDIGLNIVILLLLAACVFSAGIFKFDRMVKA
ncbi:MAG: ABC transporter permease [Thermotogota bacterium]